MKPLVIPLIYTLFDSYNEHADSLFSKLKRVSMVLTVSCPDNHVQRSLNAVVGIQDRTVSIALQNGVHQ